MGFWDDVNPQSVANANDGFSEFKVGDNDAIIDQVEEGRSKSNNEMIIVHFKNEIGAKIRFYIVNDEYKLQKIKQLQIAFGIPIGNIYFNSWIGKRGIVVCKQGKPYEGRVRNEVSYLKPIQRPGAGSSAPSPQGNSVSQNNISQPSYRDDDPPMDDDFDDDIPF